MDRRCSISPLPHYLSGLHQAITDVNPLVSVRVMMVLSLLAAGVGMYLFVRGRWGSLAGIIAAVMYLYSPPLALTLPYSTGDLALLLALALLPLTLWSLDRLRYDNRSLSVLLAIAISSAYLLTDARLVTISAPLLLWCVTTIAGSPRLRRRASSILIAAFLLAAFFWLPALLERSTINWISATPNTLSGAVPITEAFATMPGYEKALLNPAPSRSIGLSAWLLTLGGIAAVLALQKPPDRSSLAVLMVLGLLLVGTASQTFSPLFYAPPTVFMAIQPYHALLIALVCFCLVSAQIGRWLQQEDDLRWRIAGTVGACLFPLLTALPAAYPPPWTAQNPPTVQTMISDELPGYHSGTLRDGILLPASMQELPAAPPRLLQDLQEGTFTRVLRGSLSGETRLDTVVQGPTQSRFTLVSERAVTVTLGLLNWAGWNATFDGRPLATSISPEGFLRLSLPADRGNVEVSLGATGARDAAWALTFAGVVATILLIRRRPRWQVKPLRLSLRSEDALVVAVVLIAWIGLTAWIRSEPALISTTQTQQRITPFRRFWQGGVDLLGYNLPDATLRAGGSFTLTAYWGASRPIVGSYQSQLLLTDAAGRIVAVVAHRHPGGIPALRWVVNQFVRDEFTLQLPTALSAGQYSLRLRLGACSLNQLLPCADDDLELLDATDELGRSTHGAVILPLTLQYASTP
ncbi:MAG: 6-pyruvoyl-tetrahydropterin synthase-related protein [Anaerolineae bacterium]